MSEDGRVIWGQLLQESANGEWELMVVLIGRSSNREFLRELKVIYQGKQMG